MPDAHQKSDQASSTIGELASGAPDGESDGAAVAAAAPAPVNPRSDFPLEQLLAIRRTLKEALEG